METGAGLVINTDAHSPGDLISIERAKVILLSAGITEDKVRDVFANSQALLDKILGRK